jgi:ech hydrogenase subunit A
MLISKWAALKSFIDSGDIWIVLALVFGSAATLFYWTKWLGKTTAVVAGRESIEDRLHTSEWWTLTLLTVFTIGLAVTFPFFSERIIVKYLGAAFSGLSESTYAALSTDNLIIMMIMVVLIIVLALLFYGRAGGRIVPIYMAGVNKGDNLTYSGAMQKDMPVSLRNWYLDDVFPERLMNRIGIIITCCVFAVTFSYAVVYASFLYQLFQMGGGM